ncbi:MAG: hypothetical protein ACPG4N_03460 [Gammaproteobacteria bacterium]
MNRLTLSAKLAGIGLCLSLASAQAAMISATRTDVWNADPSITNGDTNTTGTVDGESWSFSYTRVGDFNINASTVYTAMGAGTYFGSPTPNVFGDYFTGFGSGNPYFEDSSANGTAYGHTLGAVGSYEDVSVSGSLAGLYTGGTGNLTVNWKLVEFDLATNAYNLLDSGTLVATGFGDFSNAAVSGDLAVSGMASLQTGDWVGMFYQKASNPTGGGSHFNLSDAGISYTFEQADSPLPSPTVPVLMALGLLGIRTFHKRS